MNNYCSSESTTEAYAPVTIHVLRKYMVWHCQQITTLNFYSLKLDTFDSNDR